MLKRQAVTRAPTCVTLNRNSKELFYQPIKRHYNVNGYFVTLLFLVQFVCHKVPGKIVLFSKSSFILFKSRFSQFCSQSMEISASELQRK